MKNEYNRTQYRKYCIWVNLGSAGRKWDGLLPISRFFVATGVPNRDRPHMAKAACMRARQANCTGNNVHNRASAPMTWFWAHDNSFSVATGVIGFHVTTWSIVSRHGSSTAGAAVSREGMPCRDRVPRHARRVGSRQRLLCRDRDVLTLFRNKECCVTTGLGLGLSG